MAERTPAPKRFARIVLDPLDQPEDKPDDDSDCDPGDRCRAHALRALPASQRLALLLRDAQGLTYAEIAHVLGFGRWAPRQVAHWMVRRLVYNAREALRLAVLSAQAQTPAAGGFPATLLMEKV